ncbi:MAG TPA: CocE/NonD family hydrolase [Solirubrobacteraceae bacterium]|nr:CocE/NonD family hydrolase [Solirubrobacteraceae bacterium]
MRAAPALAAACVCLVLAPAASAEQDVVRSFDGTPIVFNFFAAEGLEGGERAPSVFVGPGFSSPGETDPESESSTVTGGVGLGALRRAGYNVVTYDPRGFGGSGGAAQIDSPDFEARDVMAVIDRVATRDEVALDAPGDPVLGMSGASYGGGIQFVTAAIDPRVDAITPTIAWNSLVTSLFKAGDLKAGWGAALCGLGQVNGLAPGLISPAGFQTGTVDEHVTRVCVEGISTGTVRPEDKRYFAARGPAALLGRIEAPALIVQGTVDTLFTLQEAVDNFAALDRETDVPLRMMWFCGGHGACRTGTGEPGRVERRVIAWLDRWLRDDRSADVGPRFEWLADDARWRTAANFPIPRTGALRGSGAGNLALTPASNSGVLVLATPVQAGGLDIPIGPAPKEVELLGAPVLRLTYRGHAPGAGQQIYAQLVDEQRDVVVGNQVTPIPVTLDGQPREVELPLEPIAAHATRGDRYRLQLVASTTVYYPQTAAGAVTVQRAEVELPVVDPARAVAPSGDDLDLRLTRRCIGDGRLRMNVVGEDVDAVRDVSFKFSKRLVRRDTAAPWQQVASRRALERTGATRLRAIVFLREGNPPRVILGRSLPRCGL